MRLFSSRMTPWIFILLAYLFSFKWWLAEPYSWKKFSGLKVGALCFLNIIAQEFTFCLSYTVTTFFFSFCCLFEELIFLAGIALSYTLRRYSLDLTCDLELNFLFFFCRAAYDSKRELPAWEVTITFLLLLAFSTLSLVLIAVIGDIFIPSFGSSICYASLTW